MIANVYISSTQLEAGSRGYHVEQALETAIGTQGPSKGEDSTVTDKGLRYGANGQGRKQGEQGLPESLSSYFDAYPCTPADRCP